MDVLTFDVALAAKLKKAMNHAGWKEEDINDLAESLQLPKILEVVRRQARVFSSAPVNHGNFVSPTVNWACYWSLKLMQQELGCSEVELHACTGCVEVGAIDERLETKLAYRTIQVKRWLRVGFTSVTCHLSRNQEGSWWITQMHMHTPTREKGKRTLHIPFSDLETKLPGYPTRLDDKSFKE